jgi:hypothetical protein
MKPIFAVILLCITSVASANYFFMIGDEIQAECTYTPIETLAEAIKHATQGFDRTCTGATDVAGSITLTCEGTEKAFFFFSKEASTCEEMRQLMQDMSNRLEELPH